MRDGSRRPLPAGPRRAVARAGVLVFLIVLVSGAWQMPFIPWAGAFGLWPTLTGRWVGQAVAADGRQSFLYLDLDGTMSSRSGGGPSLSGSARWCEQGREVRDYSIYGAPDNWRGSRFHVETGSRVEHARVLSALRGEWQGDEIRAEGRVVTYTRTTAITESQAPAAQSEVLRYTFRRGTEAQFDASCRRSLNRK